MLLRRVTKHVKDQNWFAVLVDFFIVVVGILLAFQITKWNESKQDRIDEQYYLNRIIGDIDESIANNKKVISLLENKSKNSYWVVSKLQSGKLEDNEIEIFKERFLLIGNWLTADFIDSTINELQNNGRLDIIQSEEFREHLGRFQLTLQSVRRGQINIADMHKTLMHEINARVDRGSNKSDIILPSINESPEIATELLSTFDELAQNKELHRFVERYAFFYQVRLGLVQVLQKALEVLRDKANVALETSNA